MIKKIYFENFKSFLKTELQIENITTLIGTNAAGKTNAIEGMMILSEMMSGRDLAAILDGTKNSDSGIRGGARGCCRFDSDYFVLGCTVQYDESIDLEYRIRIEVRDRVMVAEEKLFEVNDGSSRIMYDTKPVDRRSGDIVVVCNNGKKGRNPDITCIRLSAVISQMATKLPQERHYGKKIVGYANTVINTFKDILYLNPETYQMRGYSMVNDTELKVNASNISAVLYALCQESANRDLLMDIMQKLPENKISDITFMEGPLNDVILFLEEKSGKEKEKIDATRLSDGTLRCLAIVAAVLREKKGGMIVIEEIDNGIHPGRAKTLIRLISDIARQRRVDVLITTHNAILLNALGKEDLAGVEIVYRDEEEGDGRFIPLIGIDRMPELLANGKLGDVFTSDMVLEYIKQGNAATADYSWLED